MCETCLTNRAVTVDFRELDGIVSKYASCDSCRFLSYKYWLELRNAMNKVNKRCDQCMFRILHECEYHNMPMHFVNECEHGKVDLPVWFLNEHVIQNNY